MADYILRNIPESTWHAFQAACRGRGLTARAALLTFLENYAKTAPPVAPTSSRRVFTAREEDPDFKISG